MHLTGDKAEVRMEEGWQFLTRIPAQTEGAEDTAVYWRLVGAKVELLTYPIARPVYRYTQAPRRNP